MTQIGRMFWEEREQAIKEAVAKTEAKTKAKTLVQTFETLAKNVSLTVEETCKRFGLSWKDYTEARSYLSQLPAVT